MIRHHLRDVAIGTVAGGSFVGIPFALYLIRIGAM